MNCPICGNTIDGNRGGLGNWSTIAKASDGTLVEYRNDELCYNCWTIHRTVAGAGLLDAKDPVKLAYLFAHKFKQVQVARALKVSQRTIRRWKKQIAENLTFYQDILSRLPPP